eukprot:Em1027g1a
MPPRKRKAPTEETKIEDEFQVLSCEDIRKELQSLGENPGPIDASNKDIYVRLLARKKLKTVDTDEQPRDVQHDLHAKSAAVAQLASPRPPLRHSLAPEAKRVPMPPKVKPTLAVPSTPPRSAQTVLYFEARGLTAATFTPFTDSGEVNLLMIRQYADYLCQRGVLNVFVNGTAGEGLTLTVSERKLVAEEWVKVAAGSGGRYQILYGCDETPINFVPGKLYNRLLAAFQKGDLNTAKLEQRRSLSHGQSNKQIWVLDVGPPRLPALPLSVENVKSLEKDLRDIGFFDWA